MAVVINVVGKTSTRDLEKMTRELNKMRKSAEKAAGGIGGAIQKTGDRVRSVGQNMADTGDKMTRGVTLPVLAAGGAFLKMSTDMNAGMANVGSLGLATERVEELKGGVQDLSVEVGKSTDDLSEGLYNVVSAFGDSSDSMKILDTNARAATAGLASTTDAINLTSAVTKGYGDTSAAAVEHAADLALKTVELGQTTFPELAASIGKVTPLTAALGVSQEELFGTMATFTGVTGGAAEVSTQLRGVMQGLMQPTAGMSALMKDLGVESGEAMIEQFGLQGSLDQVAAAAEKSGKPLGTYLSSIEAQTLALAATGGQADAYTEKTAAMSDATGATDKAFKAQTEGINEAGFQMKQAKQEAIVMGQRLGDTLAPALLDAFDAAKPLIAKVEEGVTWFTNLDEAQQKNIIKWVAIAAAMGPVMSITGRLLKPVGSMIKLTGKMTTNLGHLARGFGKNAAEGPKWAARIGSSTKAVGRGIKSAATATWSAASSAGKAMASWIASSARWVAAQLAAAGKALASMAATAGRFIAHYARMAAAALANAARMAASWVIAMGPIGWVIAAVVGLVALIIANWDKVKRWTKAAWDWVSQKIAAVWAAIKRVVLGALAAVINTVRGAWDTIKNATRAVFDWVRTKISQVLGAVKTLFLNFTGPGLIIKHWDTIKAATRAAWDWVTGKVRDAIGFVKDLFLNFTGPGLLIKHWDSIREGITGVTDFFRDKWDAVMEFFGGLPGKISAAASGMWDGITSAFKGAINSIIRGWNGLEFRIPGFKIGPVGYDGFTLGVPDIPQLASGAIVKATRGGTLAHIGEGRHDEAVIPLPSSWRRDQQPGGGGRSVVVNIHERAVVVEGGSGDDRALKRAIDDGLDRLASRIVAEVHAGAGAA